MLDEEEVRAWRGGASLGVGPKVALGCAMLLLLLLPTPPPPRDCPKDERIRGQEVGVWVA